MLDFLVKSKTICVLSGTDNVERSEVLLSSFHKLSDCKKTVTLVHIISGSNAFEATRVEISQGTLINADEAGLIVLTSGTSGAHKSVVLPRKCLAIVQNEKVPQVTLSYRPGCWLGGMRSLVTPVLSGHKLYIMARRSEQAYAEIMMETIQRYGITDLVFEPLVLRWWKHLLATSDQGPSLREEIQQLSCFKNATYLRCSAASVESSTMQFWKNLTGMRFVTIYGVTELGGSAIRGAPTIEVSY